MTGLDSIWESLQSGDPGPAVGLIDALIANDFSFAAGGLLDDLAERMITAGEFFDDVTEHDRFVDAVDCVLRYALPDNKEYDALLAEARDAADF